MHKKVLLALLLASLAGPFLAAQAAPPDPRLGAGIAAFGSDRYREALDQFSSLLADPRAGELKSEASYWSILSYVALGDGLAAEKAIDAYLSAWPDGERRADLLYQRGRLLYARGEFDPALASFSEFVSSAPEHSLIPSALYWGGECLYSLGRLEEADRVFSVVIERFPNSVKVEASRYRREVIGLESRERELLRLLSWSHEESLKAAEDFRFRERSYEDTLAAYQRQTAEAQRLAGLASPELKARIAELSAQLAASQAELDKAKAALEDARRQAELAAQVQARPPTVASPLSPAPATSPAAPGQAVVTEGNLLNQALDAKRRALDLLAFYLERLSEGSKK